MERYRITNTLPGGVRKNIQPGFVGYRLLQPNNDGASWRPVGPKNDELRDQEWYDSFVFMDPNEINSKMGFPPNYVVLKKEEETIKEWVEKNFCVDDVEKDELYDFVFAGEYKC